MPTSPRILVSGSLAYDHVMGYEGLFKDVILPEKLDRLGVTFTSPTKSVHYGGCGGNIAYTLKLLGANPLLLGVAGKDFEEYQKWLAQNEIDVNGVRINPDLYTACATILTDREQNQVTIFHEGAMGSMADTFNLDDYASQQPTWAIIAPDDARRMVRLAKACAAKKIPCIFDPSQQIGNLSKEDLLTGIQSATLLIANDYEAELLSKKLDVTREELSMMAPNYIETHGAKGCDVICHPELVEGSRWNSDNAGLVRFHVPAVQAKVIADPTGCGDAFRAGVLWGLVQNLSLEKACKIGALAATYNLEQKGTQGHYFTMEEFWKRFELSFA